MSQPIAIADYEDEASLHLSAVSGDSDGIKQLLQQVTFRSDYLAAALITAGEHGHL